MAYSHLAKSLENKSTSAKKNNYLKPYFNIIYATSPLWLIGIFLLLKFSLSVAMVTNRSQLSEGQCQLGPSNYR